MPVATDTPAPTPETTIRVVLPPELPDLSIDAARVLLQILGSPHAQAEASSELRPSLTH
jgi:hypothetical protein